MCELKSNPSWKRPFYIFWYFRLERFYIPARLEAIKFSCPRFVHLGGQDAACTTSSQLSSDSRLQPGYSMNRPFVIALSLLYSWIAWFSFHPQPVLVISSVVAHLGSQVSLPFASQMNTACSLSQKLKHCISVFNNLLNFAGHQRKMSSSHKPACLLSLERWEMKLLIKRKIYGLECPQPTCIYLLITQKNTD